MITEEDRKSYPSTADAAGEEAMSSFKHVLEHAIDIQVSGETCVVGVIKAERLVDSWTTGSSTLHTLKWVVCIHKWGTMILQECS